MPAYTLPPKRLYPQTPEGDEVPDFIPWRPQRQRSGGWSIHDQRLFIHELVRCGSVAAAARAVGKSARSAYLLREKRGAESFAVAWHRAQAVGIDKLRDNVIERLIDGELVPHLYHGKLIGHRRKFNDRMILGALQSHAREHHGDGANVAYEYGDLEAYRQRLENWEGCLRSREEMLSWDVRAREEQEAEWEREVYLREYNRLNKASRAAEQRERAKEVHRQWEEIRRKHRQRGYGPDPQDGPRVWRV